MAAPEAGPPSLLLQPLIGGPMAAVAPVTFPSQAAADQRERERLRERGEAVDEGNPTTGVSELVGDSYGDAAGLRAGGWGPGGGGRSAEVNSSWVEQAEAWARQAVGGNRSVEDEGRGLGPGLHSDGE
jgi:hypothetical protein